MLKYSEILQYAFPTMFIGFQNLKKKNCNLESYKLTRFVVTTTILFPKKLSGT